MRGAERWFEVELGDYKEVQGVLFPFAVAIGAKGSTSADKSQYAWERITVNPVLDDRRFTRPAPGEKVGSAETAAQPGTTGPSPATIPAPAMHGGGAHGNGRRRRRLGDHLRTRRAQHRLGGDVGTRDVGRGRARRRSAHRLCRRRERRRVEVDERRHHVHAEVRQAGRAVDRRHRDRSEGPKDRLGGHRRELDAQLASRSATASTRSTDGGENLDATWGSGNPSTL